MRIGIIGCGYVGQALAKKWKVAGHEITVTTRSLKRAYELRPVADLVYILSENWHDLLEKLDAVVLTVAPDANSDYYQTYIKTSEALLDGLFNTPVKQIIYTGSTSVYGDHAGNWVDEETPLKPANANAQILTTAENLLLSARNNDRRVCIFRLGEIEGPERTIKERVRKSQGKIFPGTGDSYVNKVHLNEILSAIDLALDKKLNGVYNLCDDFHPKRNEFYKQICEEEGLQPITWDPSLTSPHAGNKRVSNNKLKSVGWSCANP